MLPLNRSQGLAPAQRRDRRAVAWPHSETIKAYVAHGYCSRHVAAGACSYANICEHCDNYVPDPSRKTILEDQLADVIVPRNDAQHSGWTDERTRHQHVANALTPHLRTIENHKPTDHTT